MKKTNKAFTIVELVIVIAVIAILAAVLIPTFSNLIEKANESKDTSLVKNINTALVMEEVNQSKNNTMSDALEDALTHGYTIEKLTPTSNGDIVWDEVNNRFALMKNDTLFYGTEETKELVSKGDSYKLWKITDSVEEVESADAKYSFYLKDGFGESEITVKTGIDTGKNEDINISYTGKTGARSVSFNTNGGTLTIDAEKDTVNHYGNLTSVNIIAVDTNASYHENGEVLGNINVTKGRIVLESGCNVGTVAVSENNGIVKVVSKGGNAGTVVCKSGASNIEIDETIKKQELSDNEITTMKKFEGGIGTEVSPYLISSADEFLKIGDLSTDMENGKKYFFVLSNNIDLRESQLSEEYVSRYFSGKLDGNGKEIIVNDNLKSLFAISSGDVTITNLKFKLINNPVKILYGTDEKKENNIVMENIYINTLQENEYVKIVNQNEGILFNQPGYNLVDKEWGDNYRTKLTIIGCDLNLNINAMSNYNAVFIGGKINNTDCIIKDCTYSGNYIGININLVYGNTYSSKDGYELYRYSSIHIENVKNNGQLMGAKRTPGIAIGEAELEDGINGVRLINNTLGTVRLLTDNSLNIEKTNEFLTLTEAELNNVKYTIILRGGARKLSQNSENSSYSFEILIENINFVNGKFETIYKDGKLVTKEQYQNINKDFSFDENKAIDVLNENGTKFVMDTYGEVTYYVFSFTNSYYHFVANGVSSPADISSADVVIYDSNDVIVAAKEIKLDK